MGDPWQNLSEKVDTHTGAEEFWGYVQKKVGLAPEAWYESRIGVPRI
jgi:hypothetical protein